MFDARMLLHMGPNKDGKLMRKTSSLAYIFVTPKARPAPKAPKAKSVLKLDWVVVVGGEREEQNQSGLSEKGETKNAHKNMAFNKSLLINFTSSCKSSDQVSLDQGAFPDPATPRQNLK